MSSKTIKQDYHQPATGFNLDSCIEHLAHWLPTQGPIKDFIHHNTLHAFQHLSFHEALSVAGKLFGACSYLPLDDYQRLYKEGRIKEYALDWALAQTGCSELQQKQIRVKLFESDKHSHFPPVSLANHGIRNALRTKLEIDLNALVHPIIFRLLSSFLDQGISRWTLPKHGESFWDCVLRLTKNSFIPLYPFDEPAVRVLLDKNPDEIITICLQKLVGSEKLYEQYLLEVLLAHPGWSGMVRIVEETPQCLLIPRKISLKELLAVELLCELAIIISKKGQNFAAISKLTNLQSIPLLTGDVLQPKVPLRMRVWHDAMEWALHSELLIALKNQPIPSLGEELASKSPPEVQAFFCIDDRECSIRRYLEEYNPSIETFGAAGFFGIDFYYQGLDDAYPVAQCPVVITPKHLVKAVPVQQSVEPKGNAIDGFGKMHFSSHSMFRGWIYTQTLGLGYAVKMAWNVFRPTSKLPGIKTLSEVEAHSHLHLLRETDEPTPDGHFLGFSLSEMADRIGSLLRNIGLTNNFAPLVVVIAHGSSSVNNPHFAAYDCGACSGKSGAPNARAFAWMANNQGVRDILYGRGIEIPDSTRFVAALHNTSRDEISYFDLEANDESTISGFSSFKLAMQEALKRNAHERCRWFELGPQSGLQEESHDHVKSRASSIFEPRPEYNHSNNLYCIVGRRALTRGLFMDRRAFLHSYDPASDPTGDSLVKIMSAIFPVCGGINLEYLFCRIDNSVYGAGTKLPHNVIGLLGVANGVEGDLRTGLPQQMVEVHEPARLLIVIDQTRDIIDQSLAKLGDLNTWTENEWVRMVACEPGSRDLYHYSKQGWQSIEFPADIDVPVATCSESIITLRNKTIPVHQFSGELS
ncbi:DUF2309 domain-containing protein [Methylomonas sp. AM2-LC]|uniref:YbcC family protein n=1 Tax=Methylomonas sp. AM2-LC TaxID=3153301 RepID=UPI0032635884